MSRPKGSKNSTPVEKKQEPKEVKVKKSVDKEQTDVVLSEPKASQDSHAMSSNETSVYRNGKVVGFFTKVQLTPEQEEARKCHLNSVNGFVLEYLFD